MVNILTISLVTVFATIVFGGIGYWLWLKTRPKKETWNIDIYQLGEGVRPPKVDAKTGKVISNLETQDLIPYASDIIEKVYKEPGIVVYRLQKLNKTCPPIESNMVEHWGEGNNKVMGLLVGDEIFILKKGFDKKTGMAIMQPIGQSKMNLIKGEMVVRKERLTKNKDILQSISPWIVTCICMIGLVMLAYIMVSGFIEMSENLETASQNFAEETKNIDKGSRDKEAELGLQKAIEKAKERESKKANEQNKTKVPMVDG